MANIVTIMCVSFLTFFQKQKISKFQKKKNWILKNPETPCFGRKVAATGGREGGNYLPSSPPPLLPKPQTGFGVWGRGVTTSSPLPHPQTSNYFRVWEREEGLLLPQIQTSPLETCVGGSMRIRRRTVALYFNLHWDSQILVHGPQGQSNLTSFHHCVEIRISNAQCCQTLKRRSRLHGVVTNLGFQSRRAFSRDWVASKVAVHEGCDFVRMFLSSKSQRCFGLSHQIPCRTFQRDKKRIHEARSFSGPSVSVFPQDLICLGPDTKVSCTQIGIALLHLSSEPDFIFRLTPVCLVVSLVAWSPP